MSERTITGVGMPAIEECPECGSDRLYGTTVTVNSTAIGLDGSGGIARWNDEVMQDTLVISLYCIECVTELIEDAEAVHEGVDV